MKNLTICRTYDVVTPESAENGDTAEHGFILPGGWTFDLNVPEVSKDVEEHPELYWVPVTPGDVRAAVEWAQEHGCIRDNGDGSFYSEDPDVDYATGEATSYAIHFNGFSDRALRIMAKVIG